MRGSLLFLILFIFCLFNCAEKTNPDVEDDVNGGPDASVEDNLTDQGTADSQEDSGPPPEDTGTPDQGEPDTNIPDTYDPDTNIPDTNPPDTSVLSPEIKVRQGANEIPNGTGSHSFGIVTQNTFGPSITFTIENLGNANLTLSPLTLSGAQAGQFDLNTTGMLTTVPPSGETTFQIVFGPTAVGLKTAAITIPNNDPDEGTFTFSLTGTGRELDDFSPERINILGSDPLFSQGIIPDLIVDAFTTGTIDPLLSEQFQNEYQSRIDNWSLEGMAYNAYYNMTDVENDEAITAEMHGVDLNGNNGTGFSYTRPAFQNYLIDSGKRAIDLGATYITFDNAHYNLVRQSYDAPYMNAFNGFLWSHYNASQITNMEAGPNFNFRDYLRTVKVCTTWNDFEEYVAPNCTTAVNSSLWTAFILFSKQYERAWYQRYVSEVRAHAASLNRSVYIGANRYHKDHKMFDLLDLLDFSMAETFLDVMPSLYPYHSLEYAYKSAQAVGKKFWSYNFPANTTTLTGTDLWDIAVNEFQKLFIAEALANSGMAQLGFGNSNFINDDTRGDILVPYARLASQYKDLLNQEPLGEVALLYSEPSMFFSNYRDSGQYPYISEFDGAAGLLADASFAYDVLFAQHPDIRNGASFVDLELETMAKYKAIFVADVRYLTDHQVNMLDSYVSNNGSLIVYQDDAHPVGQYNEKGDEMSAGRSIFIGKLACDQSHIICFNGSLEQYHLAMGTTSNAKYISSLNGMLLEFKANTDGVKDFHINYTEDSPTLHVTRTKNGSDIVNHVYHIINRRFVDNTGQEFQWGNKSSLDSAHVDPVTGATMIVPIPEGWDSGTVNAFYVSPENPTPVDLDPSPGLLPNTISFSLPELKVWTIIKVGSPMSAGTHPETTPPRSDPFLVCGTEFCDPGHNNCDYGGTRPDLLNGAQFEWNYRYWKGFNKPSWIIPILATYNGQAANGTCTDCFIDLYYRTSSNYVDWSGWTKDGTGEAYQPNGNINRWYNGHYVNGVGWVNGSTFAHAYYFTPPNGFEGFMEFISRARTSDLIEPITFNFSKFGFGVDKTYPTWPLLNGGVVKSGYWQDSVALPSFTFIAPTDNLSGLSSIHIKVFEDGKYNQKCWDNLYPTDGELINWTICSFTAQSDTAYVIEMVPEDNASNEPRWEDYEDNPGGPDEQSFHITFRFFYGTSPVDDITGINVIEGNQKLDLTWLNGSNYCGAKIWYQRADVGYIQWWKDSNSQQVDAFSGNTKTLSGLTNGIPLKVMLRAYPFNGSNCNGWRYIRGGNEIVVGPYTPHN